MVILLADAFAPDLPGRLSSFGEVVSDSARVSEAEVIIVRSKTKVDKAMIDRSPKLKYVIRGGVGVARRRPVGHAHGAGGDRLRHAGHLDQAHAAIAGDRQALVIAEARDLDAGQLAGLDQGDPCRHFVLLAVDDELTHRSRHPG